MTSSSSSARGSVASARTIATRCCWPPERRSGRSSSRPPSPKRASSSRARARAPRPARALRAHRAEHDVLEHGQVREEVERLEDHPEPAAHLDRIDGRVGDDLAVEQHVAVVDLLEQVDAAQQRRLARARTRRSAPPPRARAPAGRCRAAPRRRRTPSSRPAPRAPRSSSSCALHPVDAPAPAGSSRTGTAAAAASSGV